MTLSELQDTIMQVATDLKETQKYLIKLAQNQAVITKRVTTWPFIGVPENDGGL